MPFRLCREQPQAGPALLARPSPDLPSRVWQFGPSDHRDKVQIRIIKDGVYVQHTIHRSVIQTSRVLRPVLHNALIWLHWHGLLDVFNMYVAWLYSDTICTNAELEGRYPATATTQVDYADLVSCWGMGMTLQDVVFQDLVLQSIRQRLQAWRPENGKNPFVDALRPVLVSDVYRETGAGAPLRKLVVDNAAKFGYAEDFEHFQGDTRYPKEFLRDLMLALGKERDLRGHICVGPRLVQIYVDECPPPPLYPPPLCRMWLVEEPEQCRVPAHPLPFCNAQHELNAQLPRSILKPSAGKRVRFDRQAADPEPEHYF